MTKKRHPSSQTTPAMRRQIQESSESSRSLARRFGVNPKTIAKWRSRPTIAAMPMGPKHPVSNVLSEAEEALIVVYRKYTRLPLDDCLRRLKPTIPKLTRSSLHRCLKRYGVHRLPKGYGQKHPPPEQGESPHFTIQIHSLERKSKEYLYSAISNSMFVFATPSNTFDEYQAARFMTELARNAPVRVQSVATSDHPVFSDSAEAPWTSEGPGRNEHPFLRACRKCQISRHSEGPRTSTPGLVVEGWGKILRRPIANRRFTPLSLADRQNLKRLAKEASDNWRDDGWDAYADRHLPPEEAAEGRTAREAARREAAAETGAEAEAEALEEDKPKRRRPERKKRRLARIAAGLQCWIPEGIGPLIGGPKQSPSEWLQEALTARAQRL
jgi:hypothetical protein